MFNQISNFFIIINITMLLGVVGCSSGGTDDNDTDDAPSNRTPTATAGSDQTVSVNTEINLSASASSDPDGDTLTYQWSITSQPAGSTSQLSSTTIVNPTITPDSTGDYIIQLIVNDGTVDSTSDTLTVTASQSSGGNQSPNANAGSDQSVTTGASVNLSASASSDQDGDNLTYQWSMTTKPNGSSAQFSDSTLVNPSFTADLVGDYIVELIVNDGTVDSTSDSITVTASNGGGGGPNSITATSISIHATFHNIGIQVDFSGDDNNNATASMEANINGVGFIPVHDLSRVFLVVSQYGEYPDRFVGSVFSVPEEATVEVRVTISDPDGVDNGVQTASITARNRQIPTSTGNEIHVAVTGDDSTGNGSNGTPYKTIQKGVDQLAVGDTLLIHTGTYHEHVVIPANRDSLSQAYTTIKSAGDGEVILSGVDASTLDASAWSSEGNDIYSAPLNSPNNETYYVGFDGNRMWKYFSMADLESSALGEDVGGFYSEASTQKVFARFPNRVAPTGHEMSVSNLKHAFIMNDVNNIVFDGLTIDNYNSAEHANSIHVTDQSHQIWIVNNRFKHSQTAIRLEAKVVDLVVMGNEFSDQGVHTMDWNSVKDDNYWLERGALYISNDEYTGYGTIFFDNYVHEMFDGVKIVGAEILTIPSNSDVVDNRFIGLSDDGVETDGYSSNVRIQNNRFESLLIGVSVAPALAGPTYIIDNLMVDLKNLANTDWETGAVKFSFGDEVYGDIFIYHNTGTTTETGHDAFSVSNDADWTKLVMKNNIWSGEQYAIYYFLDNAATLDWVQDYDLLFSNSGIAAQWQGEDYLDISEYFAASGVCEHCIESSPDFVNQDSGDYTLTAISPAVDVGLLIPGINSIDANGNLPDLGANQLVE